MTTWFQGVLPLFDDDPDEKKYSQRTREKRPHKCRLCGQLIFEVFLQGTSSKGGYGPGLKVKIESRPTKDGAYVWGDKYIFPVAEELRDPTIRYWKEHRCPGFKS